MAIVRGNLWIILIDLDLVPFLLLLYKRSQFWQDIHSTNCNPYIISPITNALKQQKSTICHYADNLLSDLYVCFQIRTINT